MVIFSVLGALILLLALQERRLSAVAALLGVGWLSADAIWRDARERRLGPASRCILALWLLSAGVALAAAWSGLF